MTDHTDTTGTERIAASNQTAIAEYSETSAALADLRERHAGVIYDVTVPKEMKLAKEARAELRGLRTSLEKKRVELKAPALERCRLLDSEAKRITAELVQLEEPIDVQIKAEESRAEAEKQAKLEAECLRVEALQARIQTIRDVPGSLVGKPSVIIAGQLAKLEAEVLDEDEFAEHFATARDALDAAIGRVKQLLADQQAHEAEQKRIATERAELEKLRAEAEARRLADERRAAAERAEADRLAQVERDRIATEEAAARAAAKAEQDRLAAVERGKQMEAAAAERERIAAERAEQEAALQAERDRQAAEQARLDAEASKLKRERQEAARKAEQDRLANLGLHDAVRAVLTHFEPMMDNNSEPQCIRDLRVAFLNEAKPARAKKVAA